MRPRSVLAWCKCSVWVEQAGGACACRACRMCSTLTWPWSSGASRGSSSGSGCGRKAGGVRGSCQGAPGEGLQCEERGRACRAPVRAAWGRTGGAHHALHLRMRRLQHVINRGAHLQQRTGEGEPPTQHSSGRGWNGQTSHPHPLRGAALQHLHGVTTSNRYITVWEPRGHPIAWSEEAAATPGQVALDLYCKSMQF